MSNRYQTLALVVSILLILSILFSIKKVIDMDNEQTSEITVLDTLQNLEREYAALSPHTKISSDSLDISNLRSPFGDKTPTKRRPVAPKKQEGPEFKRTPLKLKGILEGAKLVAVLYAPSGKTHIVSQGDVLFEREISKITKSSVTLSDPKGDEILQLQ